MTIHRMETEASIWLFKEDDDGRFACRMPKSETARDQTPDKPADNEWTKFTHAIAVPYELDPDRVHLCLTGWCSTGWAKDPHIAHELASTFAPTPQGD